MSAGKLVCACCMHHTHLRSIFKWIIVLSSSPSPQHRIQQPFNNYNIINAVENNNLN